MEIRADGLGLDPLIALNDDGADGLGIGGPCGERYDATTKYSSGEDKAGEAKPSNKPPTKFHSQRGPLVQRVIRPRADIMRAFGRRLPSFPRESRHLRSAGEQLVLGKTTPKITNPANPAPQMLKHKWISANF